MLRQNPLAALLLLVFSAAGFGNLFGIPDAKAGAAEAGQSTADTSGTAPAAEEKAPAAKANSPEAKKAAPRDTAPRTPETPAEARVLANKKEPEPDKISLPETGSLGRTFRRTDAEGHAQRSLAPRAFAPDYAFGGDAVTAGLGLPGGAEAGQPLWRTQIELLNTSKEDLAGKTVVLSLGDGDIEKSARLFEKGISHLRKSGANVLLVGSGDPALAARQRSLAGMHGFTFVPPGADDLATRAGMALAEQARVNGIVGSAPLDHRNPVFDMAFGDSIAYSLTTVVPIKGGWSKGAMTSAIILKHIKETPQEELRGKRVLLSTGSNSPDDLANIEESMRYLRDAGANVVVTGYGPNRKFETRDLNGTVEKMAEKYGFAFTGPLTVTDRSANKANEGIHPWNYYHYYAQAVRAFGAHYGTLEPKAPALGGPTAPGTRVVSKPAGPGVADG